MKQPKFEIGDRVTYASPKLPYQKNRGIGVVVWEIVSHYYIRWENSDIECPHLKEICFDESDLLMQVTEINLGDRVKNLDSGSEGVITYLSDRCMNIQTDGFIESHNLELGKPELKVLEKSDRHLTIGDRVVFHAIGFGEHMIGKIGTITEEKFDKRRKVTQQTIVWDDGTINKHHYQGSNTVRKFVETPKIDTLPEIAKPDQHGYFEHYQPVIKGAKSYWYRRYVYADISGKLVHHHVPNKMVESIETLWRSGASAKEICLALGKSCK